MSRCLRKAPGRPQETRTGVGLDMGSHSVLQRLVGPGIMRCNRPQRTFGFVTTGWGVWRVLKQGGGGSVSPGSRRPTICARASCLRYRARCRAREGTPCPPAPAMYEWGPSSIFSHFFVDNAFHKENVNGY